MEQLRCVGGQAATQAHWLAGSARCAGGALPCSMRQHMDLRCIWLHWPCECCSGVHCNRLSLLTESWITC